MVSLSFSSNLLPLPPEVHIVTGTDTDHTFTLTQSTVTDPLTSETTAISEFLSMQDVFHDDSCRIPMDSATIPTTLTVEVGDS